MAKLYVTHGDHRKRQALKIPSECFKDPVSIQEYEDPRGHQERQSLYSEQTRGKLGRRRMGVVAFTKHKYYFIFL